MSGAKANSPWVLLKLEIVLLSQLDKWKAFNPNLTRKKSYHNLTCLTWTCYNQACLDNLCQWSGVSNGLISLGSVWIWVIQGDVQSLLLGLHSGITPEVTQRMIWGAKIRLCWLHTRQVPTLQYPLSLCPPSNGLWRQWWKQSREAID